MNLRQTAELAAYASMRAEGLIQRPAPVSTESLHGYWKASQIRLKCWFAGLRAASCVTAFGQQRSAQQLSNRVRLSRSILVAEMLTRTWSTVLQSRDVFHRDDRTGDLVRNVFRGQREARNEVLQLMADETCLPAAEAASLDRLRRRIERWTDMLLGPLAAKYGVTEFAYDIDRALETTLSNSHDRPLNENDAARQLMHVGLSRAIPAETGGDRVIAALDATVAQTIFSAISPGRSQSTPPADARTVTQDNVSAPPHGAPLATPDGNRSRWTRGLRFAELYRSSERRRNTR
ncbi:MAG: hypothetical protein KF861_04240 [Planctomycetaceae bacterium]|nr:hypothetical protein [Planctomycetaceae bacterium]